MKHGPRTILLKLLTILLSGSPFRWWTRQQQTAGSGQVQLQQSLDNEPVQLRLRAINAKIAELAGTRQLKIFVMVNIKKLQNHGVLRPRRGLAVSWAPCVSDQVISCVMTKRRLTSGRAPGPGLKQQASSVKLQASSFRTNLSKHQATSVKPFAASFKRQATSCKLPDPGTTVHGYWRTFRGARTKGLC